MCGTGVVLADVIPAKAGIQCFWVFHCFLFFFLVQWVAFGGTRGPLRGGPLDTRASGGIPLNPQNARGEDDGRARDNTSAIG